MADLSGRTVGNYRILERIGRGGMATVYKAYQPSLERNVAVKVIHEMLAAEDEQFQKRFQREAKSVAALRHPNIVQVYDFGTEDDVPYMVMEYLEGTTLKAELKGLAERGETMEWEEVNRVFKAVAGAVDYAHSQGMVHRDLKPANVMLTSKGDVVLTDFGVARIVGGTQYTATGMIAGTPAYMSPEQGKGERGDARSDIYALGIILYEMLTGQVPFEADTPWAIIVKHISDPLPLPRELNPALPEKAEQVILKALAKTPDDRYQSAADMVAALNDTMVGETRVIEGATGETVVHVEAAAAPVQVPTLIPPRSRGVPAWVWAVGGTILGAFVVALVVILLGPGEEPTPTATAAAIVEVADTPVTAQEETPEPAVASSPAATRAAETVADPDTPVPTETAVPTATVMPMPTVPAGPRAGRTLFTCTDTRPPQICATNSEGEVTQLTDSLDFAEVAAPRWAPDGSRILFMTGSGQPNRNLHVIREEGSGLVQLTSGDGNDQSADWSPDGEWIAFSRDCGLWLMRSDGSDAHELRESTETFCIDAISWSPDSEKIGFINFSAQARPLHGIWVTDREGNGQVVHASERVITGGAIAWSPDGSRIFCWCNDGDESWNLLVDADGDREGEIVEWEPYWWDAAFWPRWGDIDYDQVRLVSIDLGSRNEQLGLRQVVNDGDGITRGEAIGGREARVTLFNGSGGRYFYFDVDHRFIFAEETHVLVTVEYFDQGSFTFGLNYDAVGSASNLEEVVFKWSQEVTLRNSGEWKTATFELRDAYFGNRQHISAADFRIATDENDLYINRVTVSLP
jgi:serine/threonine-protein kinase